MATFGLSFQSSILAQQNELQNTETNSLSRVDVGPVPTPQHIVNLMLELADVKPTDLLYDLGCGDGRIVITAAKKYGCQAMGVDIDPEQVREARANVKAAGVEDLVTIEQQDIFDLDLSKVDVVTLYLLPSLNEKLLPQLRKMKPGSRIVSHDFGILGVEPDIEVKCFSRIHGMRDSIYLWNVPLNRVTVAEPAVTEKGMLGALKRYASQTATQRVLLILVASVLVLASFLWLLRKRVGVIKLKLTIDRD